MSSLKDALKLLAVGVAVITLATGCVSAKKGKGEMAAAAAAEEEQMAEKAEDTMAKEEEMMVKNDMYTVAEGDNLWCIAKQEKIYNNAFHWPLIYKENKDQIKDADLIYPDQELVIPRGMSDGDIQTAEEHAKTRGAWSIPEIEASDQEYLANAM